MCAHCTLRLYERCAQVHSSERAVVYVNPLTGERRTPARADQPMPDVYASQGFERQEIMSMTEFERSTGLVHEPTNFNSGNEPVIQDPRETVGAPPELKKALVDDMRDAFASGPWTGGLSEASKV